MSEKDLTIDSEIIDEITEGKEDKHVEKHGKEHPDVPDDAGYESIVRFATARRALRER